jgi:hypothetical protein
MTAAAHNLLYCGDSRDRDKSASVGSGSVSKLPHIVGSPRFGDLGLRPRRHSEKESRENSDGGTPPAQKFLQYTVPFKRI